MSTIKTLSQLKKEKTGEEINRILSDNLTFVEKIKGHRFSVQRSRNSIKFYGKKSSKPLTTIDRVLSDLYEQSIHFVLGCDHEMFKENVRYGFYFPMRDDTGERPKNDLILTDVTKGTTINIDPKDLNAMANELDVDPPPIIFHGTLTDAQKRLLMLYDGGDVTAFVDELFNTGSGRKYGNIIIRSDHRKYTYFQIGNNDRTMFEKQDSNKFELLLLDLLEFMETNASFNNIQLISTNKDIRYVEMISIIFNQFIEQNPDYIERNSISKPEFLRNSGNLTKRYIKDATTLEHIEDENAEYLLRVFLTTFKGRIKARGLISDADAKRFQDSSYFVDDFIKLDKNIDFKEVQKYYFRKHD